MSIQCIYTIHLLLTAEKVNYKNSLKLTLANFLTLCVCVCVCACVRVCVCVLYVYTLYIGLS